MQFLRIDHSNICKLKSKIFKMKTLSLYMLSEKFCQSVMVVVDISWLKQQWMDKQGKGLSVE